MPDRLVTDHVEIRDYETNIVPHVHRNFHGGNRCDICFAPIQKETKSMKEFEYVDGIDGLHRDTHWSHVDGQLREITIITTEGNYKLLIDTDFTVELVRAVGEGE